MAMQLRSGRRLATPPPPPPPRGAVRRVRPRPSHADGEDRISDLHEDMLLEVLQRLGCAREAARTSVLSTRWRGLWTELRDLNFDNVDSLRTVLAMVRPKLDRLRILDRDDDFTRFSPSTISSLLRAADLLKPLELHVVLDQKYSKARPFEIPCFERATSIVLSIHGLHCKLPPTGQFPALEQLTLRFGFLNPSEFLHRCPRLRKLIMHIDRRPSEVETTLTVESKSLEELTWRIVRGPEGVRNVAPELKKFSLFSYSEFTVSLSAPKLEEFRLEYYCKPYRVRCGEKWHLSELKMATKWNSRHGPAQLQIVLSLIINYKKSFAAQRSIKQEIARLPVTDFSVLELCLRTQGHVFGALCAASQYPNHHTKA